MRHNYLGMLVDSNMLWVGMEEGILMKYSLPSMATKLYTATENKEEIYPAIIWMPFIANDGTVWVGTDKGIYRLDKTREQLLPFADTSIAILAQSFVYAFYTNNRGTWLSTTSGLYLVDLKQEKILQHYGSTQKGENYIPTNHIAQIHEDQEGVFWLATKGNGLIKWNPQTKEHQQFTQKGAGLSHNVLYSVYGDNNGYLWMSSQRGLMKFHKASAQVQIYLEEDGLPHNEFNTISHYQTVDGRLYFGGQNGMVHFNPNDFENQQKTAAFIITDYYKQLANSDSLVNLTATLLKDSVIYLTSSDKFFTLSFALLDFHNSKNHQYAYQIVGYDNQWNYLNNNQITINNLPYGVYELKLRAKPANSSAWVTKSIQIKALRPFYLQTWFFIITFFGVVILIYLLFKWRIAQLEQGKKELEAIVVERTAQIEADKAIIEKDKEVIEQQAEELRALDKVKSRFFGNISHELRTPLTLMLGPLSYILDSPEALDNEKIKQQLLVMQRNGKSLMQLIEEILDLSKLEANKLELAEEATPLAQFFESIFSVFEPQFQSQGIDYELNLKVGEKLTVLLDRKKLEKVMNNFLSNAIKFTPRTGKISLSVEESKKSIKITVSDTGKGVHPKDLPYIFERFYQSKQADQKLYGGTGIGLALVKEFAALMQGNVYAESTLGTGSHFYFEFPKKIVASQQAVIHQILEEIEEEPIDSVGTDFTILVVEDNPDMRDFVCNLLSSKYKTMLSAQNGLEGLVKLKEYGKEIHLIVSDVMMPEMDGLTMLQEIKSNQEWWGIPIIMLTALAAERDKLTALTIGVDDYLTKPFSVTELLVRVQNLLFNYHQRLEVQKEEQEQDISNEAVDENEKKLGVVDKLWIEEVEGAIKNSLSDEVLDVEGLAKQFFMSSRQLSRKVKEITGLSTSKFIREVQLQLARKALEDGTYVSITEVSDVCGFKSITTFSTMFKARFGKSPKDYK